MTPPQGRCLSRVWDNGDRMTCDEPLPCRHHSASPQGRKRVKTPVSNFDPPLIALLAQHGYVPSDDAMIVPLADYDALLARQREARETMQRIADVLTSESNHIDDDGNEACGEDTCDLCGDIVSRCFANCPRVVARAYLSKENDSE